jgi:hypothetical protein
MVQQDPSGNSKNRVLSSGAIAYLAVTQPAVAADVAEVAGQRVLGPGGSVLHHLRERNCHRMAMLSTASLVVVTVTRRMLAIATAADR